MLATQWAQDHLIHFYHLHALDWVDVVSSLKADPKQTSALAQSISPWPNSSPGYFRDVQTRLKKFVDSGQLGPFMNGYWGNRAYLLPPEANLMAVAHYLEALDFQREIVKIHTVFGGKNPHPNWLVGGMACAINLDEPMAAGAPVNMAQLELVSDIIDRTIAFIDQVYLPDLKAIASFYKAWDFGGGLAGRNIMSYGEFPLAANDWSESNLAIPSGAIVDGNLGQVHEVDVRDTAQVQEFVDHSWYKYPDEARGLHPWEGITEPDFRLGARTVGTRTDIRQLDESAKYSFIKAPRWRGHAMEVGPLSRFTIGYARGIAEFKEPVDKLLSDLQLPLGALFTTLGRTAARGLEASWAAHRMRTYHDRLMANLRAGDLATASTDKWEPSTWAPDARGVGRVEAPRGALGHWVHIKDRRIESYQAVVPTTWNGSPRDPAGNIGAFEAALLGTPLAEAAQPLEILRTLHSFDPCLACSTHVIAPDGGELVRAQVQA
jgi:hydrogenase large subunit